MLRSAPRVSAHTTHRRMAQAPGNGAGAKNGARHPPLAPSPSAEKRTHQPPVFLGGVSGEYDFPGASAGALYDGFHPGGTPIPVTAASAYRSPTTTGDARVAEDATSRRASQLKRCRGAGFIAALDQSGGSTPRALSLYGINDIRADDKDAMFAAVHASAMDDMNDRIDLAVITSRNIPRWSNATHRMNTLAINAAMTNT